MCVYTDSRDTSRESSRIELDEAIMSSETAKLMRKVQGKRNRFIIIFYGASVTIIANVFAPIIISRTRQFSFLRGSIQFAQLLTLSRAILIRSACINTQSRKEKLMQKQLESPKFRPTIPLTLYLSRFSRQIGRGSSETYKNMIQKHEALAVDEELRLDGATGEF